MTPSSQTTSRWCARAGTALSDVDFDSAVLRLIDFIGGRHEQLALAPAGGADTLARNADADEKALDALGALGRKLVVGRLVAHRVGMADDEHIGQRPGAHYG